MLDGPVENKAIGRPEATKGDGPEATARGETAPRPWKRHDCTPCGKTLWVASESDESDAESDESDKSDA